MISSGQDDSLMIVYPHNTQPGSIFPCRLFVFFSQLKYWGIPFVFCFLNSVFPFRTGFSNRSFSISGSLPAPCVEVRTLPKACSVRCNLLLLIRFSIFFFFCGNSLDFYFSSPSSGPKILLNLPSTLNMTTKYCV